MTFANLIRKADIFYKPQREEGTATILGGILSILAPCGVIAYCVIFGMNLVYENVTITSSFELISSYSNGSGLPVIFTCLCSSPCVFGGIGSGKTNNPNLQNLRLNYGGTVTLNMTDGVSTIIKEYVRYCS